MIKLKYVGLLAIIPLVFSIGIIPAFDFFKEAEAVKASGKSILRVGSEHGLICGDRLCSELEQSKIKLPVDENGFVSTEENYVETILVQFSNGDFTENLTIDTFSRFNSGNDVTVINKLRELGFQSYFLLESLPSKDKIDFYKLVSNFINPGKIPLPFDVKISAVMSDGSIIISSDHKRCHVREYSLRYQDNSLIYQFTKEKKGEIRDRTLFYCGGAQISDITNAFSENEIYQKQSDAVSVYVVPEDNDRTQSFVVHFFDGDLEKVHTFHTFKEFSHISDSNGNPSINNPEFFLESLPTKDKEDFYKLLSRYINPVKLPQSFNVSIDSITGDGTILQRWNFVGCNVSDYTVYLEEDKSRFHFSGKDASEIIERSDFKCAGFHLKIHDHDKIDDVPIQAGKLEQKLGLQSDLENFDFTDDTRAMTYEYHFFGGQLEQTHIYTNFPKFSALSWKKPLVPANHPNQYQHGYLVESNPSRDKSEIYEFLEKYINPGKKPEPFKVDVSVMTGDSTVLYTLKYTLCSAVDYDWYVQEYTYYYGLSNIPLPELRERYINYCNGFTVDVP